MWSKHLVPIPKDWGPHIDVVGFFLNKPDGKYHVESQGGHQERSTEKCTQQSESTTSSRNSLSRQHSSEAVLPRPHNSLPPLDSCESNAYQPSEELRLFLESGPPPVFVGFGSMVVEDATSLIQVS